VLICIVYDFYYCEYFIRISVVKEKREKRFLDF